MTLYRKYRPQKISELDLTSVREQLTNIIKSGNMPHAFLFSGPKGTGKTSAARILAKVINCENPKEGGEPCNECEQCLSISKGSNIDVIEMDAASNRGIDDIRLLRESVNLSPSMSKKKVYIIDEVHMITNEAANAFLKTLEEPPSHVVFILATTNPEKLPDTIHSRLTNIYFTRATNSEIARQLGRVVEGEKFDVEDGVVTSIANASDGSFRDAVKILEQLSLGNSKITLENTNEILFQTKLLGVDSLLPLIISKDCVKALEEIEAIAKRGGPMKLLLDGLIAKLHEMLLKLDSKSLEMVPLLEALLEARKNLSYASITQLPLEMAVVKWCGDRVKEKEPIKPVVIGEKITDELWKQIIVEARAKNASVEALLRASKPMGFDGNNLTIGVYYQFHKERLEGGPNLQILEKVLESVFGKHVRVTCVLAEKEKISIPKAVPEVLPDALTDARDSDIIKAAEEVFGI